MDRWEYLLIGMRVRNFLRVHNSLIVIIVAALLLELTTWVMYYSAHSNIQSTMERLVDWEMTSTSHRIRNQLAKVEVSVDNMAWVVSYGLDDPADSMFTLMHQFVDHNDVILGSGVLFIPNYYPEKGRWFEPYVVRRADETLETMQLGSAQHDYQKAEIFNGPIEKGGGYWSAPYMDKDGAKTMVTTYGVPVYDSTGKTVAVLIADFSLDWIDGLMNKLNFYKSTRRFLITGNYDLLAGEDDALFRESLKLLKADIDKRSYETLKDVDGNKKHLFFQPIGGNTDWILISILNDSDVFGKLRLMRFTLLLLALAVLLFTGFIVWRSSNNLERLREANAEKDRISGELRVASQIQQTMLPPRSLDMDGVNIYGSLVPAREVGGDLFDYYIRDEKLFFCVGDVSGKGAPSAMLMGVIHSLFRAFSAHENNPARVIQAINENSCRGNDANMFVTLFMGVLDLPTGHLRFCNAGHDAPIVLHDGQSSMLNVKAHLPVGVFDDTIYEVQETHLEPGSTIFLYTDGLTEAKKGRNQLFGIQYTEKVLTKCALDQMMPRQILEVLTQEVHRFVGDAEQSDDLTMLAIRYMPKQFNSTVTETLVLKNNVKEVTRFSSFIKSVTEKLGIEKSLARQLRLAVEEAVVNVIDYAYPAGTEGDITIKCMSDGKTLRFQIIDSGVAFDPTAKEKADTTLSAEDRQIGGLGILLVRELMDSINYERENGKNILTLIKNLKQ